MRCAWKLLVTAPWMCPLGGANTIRTEFSFLTGIAAQALGVHRFNPYRAIARGWSVDALPLFLKKMGYRTVCVHPYWGNFYGRKYVLPRLGFDTFLDIGAFQGAQRAGAYISDIEVAKKILALLKGATDPLFIFAITMENHGPLQFDHIPDMKVEKFYSTPLNKIYKDLDNYLYHLKNADTMLSMLHTTFNKLSLPISFCFYGDTFLSCLKFIKISETQKRYRISYGKTYMHAIFNRNYITLQQYWARSTISKFMTYH